MTSNRMRLIVALLLASAVLPGWAFAGEPASTATYEVRGTTIQWNHAGRTAGDEVRPEIADDLRAVLLARLNGEVAPATKIVAQEKLANGIVRSRVPAEKYSVMLFRVDPTQGLLGADGTIQLHHGNQTCHEAGHLNPPTRILSSDAPLY